MSRFIYDDGGRSAAGYKGKTGDCACRAITIATGKPYAEVYADLNRLALSERTGKRKRGTSDARTGVYTRTFRRYMGSLGWVWHPTMTIGSGCRTHLRPDELPSGRIIVNLSRHYAAVINGVLHDTFDCSRGGTRCVYGFWTAEEGE